MAEAINIELITPDLVLEGGSIDAGENQTLLVSESSVVNPNRFPLLNSTFLNKTVKKISQEKSLCFRFVPVNPKYHAQFI